MASGNAGSTGARDVWYEDLAAGSSSEGREDCNVSWGVGSRSGLMDTELGRDGKSCDNLSEPDVLRCGREGRLLAPGLARAVAGEPARSASGTSDPGAVLRGDGDGMMKPVRSGGCGAVGQGDMARNGAQSGRQTRITSKRLRSCRREGFSPRV